MDTQIESKKAKLRFVGMYALSVILIFIVITAFFNKKPQGVQNAVIQLAEGEGYFIQFDTVLYKQLDELDNMYTLFLQNSANNTTEMDRFFSLKNSMLLTLDSIEQQAVALTSGAKKNAMQMITGRYKASLDIRSNLINQLASTPKDKLPTLPAPTNTDTPVANGDEQGPRNMLAEKDREIVALQQKAVTDLKQKDELINSLEAQLKQKSPGTIANTPPSNEGEWRQKYSSLKASYDKISATEKTVRNAYQIVVEDNRRLLSQLQSLKKG